MQLDICMPDDPQECALQARAPRCGAAHKATSRPREMLLQIDHRAHLTRIGLEIAHLAAIVGAVVSVGRTGMSVTTWTAIGAAVEAGPASGRASIDVLDARRGAS
jgi:hypothetical protein